MSRITHVLKRTGAVVPFNKQRIATAVYQAAVAVGGRDRELAEAIADRVVQVLEDRSPQDHVPTVEEIQDVVEKVLIESGHARTAKAYILYRDERARRRRERAGRSQQPSDHIPWAKLWEALDWAVAHDLLTIAQLNERIAQGEYPQIVRETDHFYIEDVTTSAEMIRGRRGQVRLVIIAGPSASGKTTTTLKLSHLLREAGIGLVPLNLDNYFFDLELHPRDEFGDYDFETPQALDLDLINRHLKQLLAGEKVTVPFYNFRTGRRHDARTPMAIQPEDMILIDSLHGLYPDMTAGIQDDLKFRLYVEPLLQMKGPQDDYIRWADLRLMRRMVRDAVFRAYDPQRTLAHWHYVRKSELRNIIRYASTADYIINTGLPYELPVMRARLFEPFEGWMEEYRDDPLRRDAYERAERIYRLLEAVTEVRDESSIPPDSLLREFIGGSCYDY